jgi:hypothetical protein
VHVPARDLAIAAVLLVAAAACDHAVAEDGTPDASGPRAIDAAPPGACGAPGPADLQLGTSGDDEVLGLALDDRDELLIAGFERGTNGVTNIEPDGDAIGVVLAYAPGGERRWRTTIDTPGTDTVEDLAIDRDTGAIVLVGRTSGALPGATNAGQFDVLVGELEPGGGVVSLAQLGDERPQHPTRVSLGPDGVIGVAGWDDTYVPTNYVEAWQDGAIARFDRRGPGAAPVQAWRRLADPVHFNTIAGVAVEHDGSGAIYAAGSGRAGPYLEKRDAGGELVWRRAISNASPDQVTALVQAPSGALYVTGGTLGQLGAHSFGQEDAFVARIDPATGAIVWMSQAGGLASDYPTALALGPDGAIVIAGITFGSVVDGAVNQGGMDVFAMRFSPDGTLRALWQRGSAGADVATSVVVDRCGTARVGGWTNGALVAGATPAGRADMFVLSLP